MVSVSQFPLSVIAIFIYRVLIWLVFQFFLGVIVNSSCDTEGGRGTKVADVVFSLARVAWEVARFGKNSELEFLR